MCQWAAARTSCAPFTAEGFGTRAVGSQQILLQRGFIEERRVKHLVGIVNGLTTVMRRRFIEGRTAKLMHAFDTKLTIGAPNDEVGPTISGIIAQKSRLI